MLDKHVVRRVDVKSLTLSQPRVSLIAHTVLNNEKGVLSKSRAINRHLEGVVIAHDDAVIVRA